MADTGFNVSEFLDAKEVALNIPPSLDQSDQLSECDRVKLHRIALVCVHTERAIDRINVIINIESQPSQYADNCVQ